MSRYVPWHISLLPLPHGLLNNDGHMRSSSLYMCVNILLLRPLEWRTCIYIYSHIERVCKCNNHKDSIMLLCHSFYNKAFFSIGQTTQEKCEPQSIISHVNDDLNIRPFSQKFDTHQYTMCHCWWHLLDGALLDGLSTLKSFTCTIALAHTVQV
jgi:hypothetical protein